MYVIPLTKRIKRSKFVSSFNEGFNTPMNNASRFFLRCSCTGALHKILCLNCCITWYNMIIDMSSWFRFMSRVIMFSPTCNTVSFRFANRIFGTFLTFSKINFIRWVKIFVFQCKQRTYFSCFPTNYNSETCIGKLIKLFNEVLRFGLWDRWGWWIYIRCGCGDKW